MNYLIIEYMDAFIADPIIIKEFKYKVSAKLYKWWHYGNAEPAWQLTHRWEISALE